MGVVSPYQLYENQKRLARCLPIYAVKKRYIPIYYEVIDQGKAQMIVPLCMLGRGKYEIIGAVNGIQVCDFIYRKSCTIEKFQEYMLFLLEHLKIETMRLVSILPESYIFQAIPNLEKETCFSVEINKKENVNIPFEAGYEMYYNSLSKHTRQNLRTAYNRAKKDGVKPQLELVYQRPLEQNKLNRIINLYCKRHEERYNVKTTTLKKTYLKYFDFSTCCQQYYNDNFYAILSLGGEVAAFLSGLIDRQYKRIIIPRLSISNKFTKYSPGVILLNETIKNIPTDLGVINLDLSKGVEQYKVSMGGLVYPTYELVIKRSQSGLQRNEKHKQ